MDRRATITGALYDCISRQGYANTTLTDIADQAKMSPSHVSYYFDNKAAILEYYSLEICERMLANLPDLAEPDSDRLIDAIAQFCFGRGQLNTSFLGVIQEISGLAVHDRRLREIKSHHATAWRRYFAAFFGRASPASGLAPSEKARLAHAMLVGLGTNTFFDRGLTRSAAQGLFRDFIGSLVAADPPPGVPRRRAS